MCYPAHIVGYPAVVGKICVVTLLQITKDRLRNTMSDLTASRGLVLLLGAGFVVKPTLDILADAGIDVTVGMRLALQCGVN